MIRHRGLTLVDSRNAWRTLETSHPPTYYIPQSDIAMTCLSANGQRSLCEWKGQAQYWDAEIDGQILRSVAWSYSDPAPAFAGIADHLAFYAEPFDECLLDGEQVVPQPGGFYGGWITSKEAGPFKGVPGSQFW